MLALSREPNEAADMELSPQLGPQEQFLFSEADIAIFGGQAGGGKSYGLLLEATRHIDIPTFQAVIFRREFTEIAAAGGLWDTAREIYPWFGGRPIEGRYLYRFPSGAKIAFAHMQHEDDRLKWQGSQIPMIGFDELTTFTWRQFSFMLSRNRSTCGVPPYIRATCNPDPDHFLRQLISWWIDDETGLAIKERSGVIRYFINRDDELHWADSPDELTAKFKDAIPKSLTFINSTVFDNRILMRENPEYLANLQALPKIDRERLLHGNWNARATAGMYFQRHWFEVVDAAPAGGQEVRYWDRAATDAASKNAAQSSWTAGVRMRRSPGGVYYVLDVCRFQGSPLDVERTIRQVASQDGTSVIVGIEQDPGQAGKAEAQLQVRNLAGYNARVNPVHESKGVRAKPVSAQAEAGNVKLVRGMWNEAFLNELQNFDGTESCTSDQVDALSGAFMMLNSPKRVGTW
ncbi:MAG TPA: phage terminase large subunit [Myxococcota bacterium]|nr:phage terminase large subunit [Myxococcota bacterium]